MIKKLLSLFIVFFLLGCSASNEVYWCGDHPCINMKEKEAYFKETMIIEVKRLNEKEKKEFSEIEKVFEQAYKKKEEKRVRDEKSLSKEVKFEERKKKEKQKKLSKEMRLKEKQKLKLEKKQAKLDAIQKKKNLAKEKKSFKKSKDKSKINSQNLIIDNNSDFSQIVEKITERNKSKPYPNLNVVND